MNWLDQLKRRLFGNSQGSAQRTVNQRDETLADLRAHVASLPPEQRAAFGDEVRAAIQAQAKARNNLDDALDDRYKR